jgi:hypothetical protein
MIKKSLKSKRSKSHTWAPLRPLQDEISNLMTPTLQSTCLFKRRGYKEIPTPNDTEVTKRE